MFALARACFTIAFISFGRLAAFSVLLRCKEAACSVAHAARCSSKLPPSGAPCAIAVNFMSSNTLHSPVVGYMDRTVTVQSIQGVGTAEAQTPHKTLMQAVSMLTHVPSLLRVLSPFSLIPIPHTLPPLLQPHFPLEAQTRAELFDESRDPAVVRRGGEAGQAYSLRQARLLARGSWITVLALACPHSGVAQC